MKPKSHIITAACVAALVFCGPAMSFAASKKSASPAPMASATPAASTTAKAPRAIPFRGMATSIDKSAMTFAIVGKEKTRNFKATDKTIVTKDGQTASFGDLSDNEKVSGSYWKQADGTLELKSLKVGGKEEAAAATATATPMKKKSKSKKTEDGAAGATATPMPNK